MIINMCNCFIVILLILGINETLSESIKISVFYESLCPDCISFIEYQLFPTYKNIGNDIKVDLIPFGNAEFSNNTGKLDFKCQHGVRECYGNMIQSCAIRLYSVDESMEFIYCAMKSEDPSADYFMEQCANSSDISWQSLKSCYTSGQAAKFLEMNGIRTKNFQPAIQFVPTVAFNNYYNETLQNDSIENLMGVVCTLLDYEPEDCKNETYDKIEVLIL